MNTRWWVLGLLVVALCGTSFAGPVVYEEARIYSNDRDKLWNPLVGYAPWLGPVGASVTPYKHVHEGDRTIIREGRYESNITSEVHSDLNTGVDRDKLWNPLIGTRPWQDPIIYRR